MPLLVFRVPTFGEGQERLLMTDSTDQMLHRLVLEALPFGVFVVNRTGKVILWSAGAEKLTGYLRQDVVGHSCGDELLSHCDNEKDPLQAAGAPLLATLREGRPASGMLSLRVKAGHFVPVQIQTVPLRDEQGTLAGAAELFEPISPPSRDERRQSKLGAYGCLDTVTGVLNHSMIQAHLKESLSLHLVYPVPFCVICIGIDSLPELRKRYGQAGVDAVFRAVAHTLENGIRPTDFIGRWLEHEFLAILTECSENDVVKVAERLNRMIRNNSVDWWGDKMRVTASIGATAVVDNDTVGSLLSRAEQALRESAGDGGNRVIVVSGKTS